MDPLFFTVTVFSGILSFGFLMGGIGALSLAADGARPKTTDGETESPVGWLALLVDLLLLAGELLPLFTLFRVVKDARDLPVTVVAMKEKWQQDPVVRRYFWMGLASLLVFSTSFVLLMKG